MNEQRGFKLLYFLLFASYSGYVMFRNVFLEDIGMSGTQMGLVGFLFPLCTILAQPVWSIIADWKGVSKLILYVSSIVAGISVLLYPLAPLVSATFGVIVVGTVLFAAFRAPVTPIANALVLSTGMSYEGVRAYGSIAFGIVGLGIGYLIGIFETDLIFFAYSAGMALVVGLLVLLPIDEPDALGNDLSLEAIRPLLNRQFLLLLGAAFALGLMTPASSAFFSVYVRSVGHPDSITGVAWLIKTVAEAAAFIYIARRGGSYRRLMVIAGGLYTTTYVVLWTTGSVTLIVFAQVLLGAGYALFNLASVNLAYSLSPAGLKSTAQSLLMVGGVSSGTAIGELLAGRLVDLVGPQEMYGALAGLGIVVALVSLCISSSTRAPSPGTQVSADGD
ncbi:MFS transporter [Natrarchaeobius chitinivorans]|uniref:MFS transporter n=1 Tax=Natrarchaeobius chitinivorans TaxID=1679083 RepID=A0A3N6M7A6_NATCH|nr:MFS transporter [Natrarchaeobius chitinivorans]RQG96524.1 MFS transporter [Natrarchaeobius chitinivorans]